MLPGLSHGNSSKVIGFFVQPCRAPENGLEYGITRCIGNVGGEISTHNVHMRKPHETPKRKNCAQNHTQNPYAASTHKTQIPSYKNWDR